MQSWESELQYGFSKSGLCIMCNLKTCLRGGQDCVNAYAAWQPNKTPKNARLDMIKKWKYFGMIPAYGKDKDGELDKTAVYLFGHEANPFVNYAEAIPGFKKACKLL